MNGLSRSVWLAWQVRPATTGGATLATLLFAIDPWLAVPAAIPVLIHLWSGFQYGADRGARSWSRRAATLAAVAIAGVVMSGMLVYTKSTALTGFAWIYGGALLMWTIAAWVVGAMGLVDDWAWSRPDRAQSSSVVPKSVPASRTGPRLQPASRRSECQLSCNAAQGKGTAA